MLGEALLFERGEEAPGKVNLFVAASGGFRVLATESEQRISAGGEPCNCLGQNGSGPFVHLIAQYLTLFQQGGAELHIGLRSGTAPISWARQLSRAERAAETPSSCRPSSVQDAAR
jgi:hypothetical protein